ncbi:DUF1343 domain-containing protein [soil metagenome]
MKIIYFVALIITFSIGIEKIAIDESDSIKTGADVLVEQNFAPLLGRNIGIITNHTATSGDRHIADLLHESEDINVIYLFGPEHGIRGDARGRIDDEVDEITGLPVHSLYGDVRKPTPEMLEGIDMLVFDIQDIGPRFYTYISTMGMAMEAAAENDISFMVLDRPNPLGGELIEGFVREDGFESFVGYFPIPVTHGLTIGELALMAKEEGMLEGVEDLDLHIVEMENWNRSTLWPDLELEWNPPSPNIPNFEVALVYPGACFFEGTNISEGRGTMDPFILIGSPWGDAGELAEDLNSRNLPGLHFEPAVFTPESITYRGMAASPKLEGVELQGIRHVITDKYAVRPVETGIHLLHTFYHHTPEDEKSEFFGERKDYLDLLAATDKLHDMIVNGFSPEDIIAEWSDDLQAYDVLRKNYYLYD